LTVAVPTLAAGGALEECLRSLESQTFGDFEVVVIDNSAKRAADCASGARIQLRVIFNTRNVGFGAAINQAVRSSQAPYVAALNDDCRADSGWIQALIDCAEANPRVGMFASRVRLNPSELDSAGMRIAADGSSKQRGHGDPPQDFDKPSETLFPSGAAAMYRREMLEQTGGFDEAFFLYCEDADLGLRARWAGWECLYVPNAGVEHRYSSSAGRASLLKAYYVERNRLYTIVKNFPLLLLLAAPFAAAARYFWHLISLFEGRGKAAEFRSGGLSPAWLPFLVFRAHAAVLYRLPRLLKERKRILGFRRVKRKQFEALLHRHRIRLRQVARL
jgi:GT2 family glycosyltransferase